MVSEKAFPAGEGGATKRRMRGKPAISSRTSGQILAGASSVGFADSFSLRADALRACGSLGIILAIRIILCRYGERGAAAATKSEIILGVLSAFYCQSARSITAWVNSFVPAVPPMSAVTTLPSSTWARMAALSLAALSVSPRSFPASWQRPSGWRWGWPCPARQCRGQSRGRPHRCGCCRRCWRWAQSPGRRRDRRTGH